MFSLSNNITNDSVLPFTLNENSLRGRIGYLNSSINDCFNFHNYPLSVSELISESLMILVLIGESLKLKCKISLQIRSEGSINIICVDYFAPKKELDGAKVRAYASFKKDKIDNKPSSYKLLVNGILTISIDQGDGKRPYQGITKLIGDNISESVSAFFSQSEQTRTYFKIETKSKKTTQKNLDWKAFGIMVQCLPSKNNIIFKKDEYFLKIRTIIENLNISEIVTEKQDLKKILYRLFHNDGCIIFKKRLIFFGCTCSEKKVLDVLKQFNSNELSDLKDKAEKIYVNCEFCGKKYIIREDEGSQRK